MTLLELLVQELPKRGGWPIDSDDERTLTATLPSICWGLDNGGYYAFRGPCDRVSHQLYEEALLSIKSGWNGEGLPPVGCEFEHSFHANGFSTWHWRKCTAIGKHGILCVDEKDTELYLNDTNNKFRPIRSEVDKKRDEAVVELSSVIDYRNGCSSKPLAGWLYDAIAAGKIPGVKLSD